MARDDFFDNLRLAHQFLIAPRVNSGQGRASDAHLAARIHSSDLWLTPKSVEGFDESDFKDWPVAERQKLAKEVAAFLGAARSVVANEPATKAQSRIARKHLDGIIRIVGGRLQNQWVDDITEMEKVAVAAANGKNWHLEQDEKEVSESLLGMYKAPRLRIRTPDHEIMLVPIVRFGSGRQGVVDLMVLPSYEREYVVVLKGDEWQIVSLNGRQFRRPFNQRTLVNTIQNLPRRR